MRVIAGMCRNHRLEAPVGLEVRPTSDKTKGAIFSMIGNDIYDSNFLDLFSGSGAIGIEALSRGAKFCTFIENSLEHVKFINKNLNHVKKALGHENYSVINRDVLEALKVLKEQFDIIFLDPPYNQNLINKTLEQIYNHSILSDFGTVIIEQDAKEELPNSEFFEIYKNKKYGRTSIYFLKKRT
ncbi:MAG: 16S rRNA (guanine(966)-N(2))-methyltransferase RsmD [Defluviitaleaceae bacterium]|nr:16S rRNA (guanine(966)-N(2))-methyltransferase RsmD [Defluviitaleaceae bacterium]